MKQDDFQQRLALVSGAARGIGAAIAGALVAAGARVAIVDLDAGDCAATAARLGPETVARGYGCNVADREAVNAAVERIQSEMGEIDFLVNNAGITRDNLLARMKPEEWDAVMAVNLGGAFNLCRALARPMMKQQRGSIVNIASVVGQIGNAGQVNYAASKAGLIGLTKSLAKELAPRNITVNAVAPGFIKTPMTDNLPDEVKASLLASIPLARLGEPEEVAAAVLWLLGDSARYVTGQVLAVNGGMAMMG